MSTASSPKASVAWVAEPTARGTVSLLVSCLSTTLICTWSALHLNVPRPDAKEWERFREKVGFFVLALVAPELTVAYAVREWSRARALTKAMHGILDKSEWPPMFSYLVLMGGLQFRSSGFTSRATPWVLNRDAVIWAYTHKHLSPKALSKPSVQDRSKASWITKTIAFFQILWFLTQLIGRAASRLSVTPLEINTLGYVVCALGMYLFWWQKPFDIQVPVHIRAPTAGHAAFMGIYHRMAVEPREESEQRPAGLLPDDNAGFGSSRDRPSMVDRVSNHMRKSVLWLSHDPSMLAPLTCFTLLFGTCHLLAWNYAFITVIESWLWRSCSVLCLLLPLLIILVQTIYTHFDEATRKASFRNIEAFTVLSILLYLSVRLILLYEVFFALRSVKPDVYEAVQWAQYMPHI